VTFYLAELAGRPVAYAAKVECPNGLGMIEDVFTLPDARKKGIASALIAHILGRLRSKIPRRPVFLGAHALQGAKHLYRRLGFQPLMVTREFLRQDRCCGRGV
jgi:predicted GNAT family acetyltransferase